MTREAELQKKIDEIAILRAVLDSEEADVRAELQRIRRARAITSGTGNDRFHPHTRPPEG